MKFWLKWRNSSYERFAFWIQIMNENVWIGSFHIWLWKSGKMIYILSTLGSFFADDILTNNKDSMILFWSWIFDLKLLLFDLLWSWLNAGECGKHRFSFTRNRRIRLEFFTNRITSGVRWRVYDHCFINLTILLFKWTKNNRYSNF